LQGRTRHLSAQDGDLVAQHDDLDGQIVMFASTKPEQLDHPNEGQIEK
jgi:hypothetical protein